MAALLRPQPGPAPECVVREPGSSTDDRLAIYRNAYRSRLRDVLRSDHPATAAGLGSRFEALARAFAEHRPTASTSLRHAGDRFPEFIAEQPLDDAPRHAELARFERILLDAFDAADAPRCRPIVPHQGVMTGLKFHPSVRRLQTRWNTVARWHAAREGAPLPAVASEPAHWIIWRTQERTTSFRAISADEARLIDCLLGGASLAEACEALATTVPIAAIAEFVVGCLTRWIADAMVSAVEYDAS